MLKKSVTKKKHECGTDEAGRGSLAGPVTAAAVILPNGFKNTFAELTIDQKNKISNRSIAIKKFLHFIIN